MAASRVPAIVNAAVDALKLDATLITLLGSGKAYTNVPANTDPPYVLVMGGDETPWAEMFAQDSMVSPGETDGGDAGGRQVDVVVQCVSTYRGSSQVDDMASRVMEVLTDTDTWSGVADFQLAQFLRNEWQPPIDLAADGTLWFIRRVYVRVTAG